MTQAFFISDLHLRSMQERNSQTLLRFLLSSQMQSATHLFLVGDIFDLWIGSHLYFQKEYRPLIEALQTLQERGVQMHYFEGNHDLYLKSFWYGQLGIPTYREAAHFDLAGLRVRVEHGDLINPDDQGYLFLRSVLRLPITEWLAESLPEHWINWIGQKASQTSRRYTSTAKKVDDTEIRNLIREHALRAFQQEPFDLIVSGHVHVEDDTQFQHLGRQVRSVNLGSWFETSKVFCLSENGAGFIELDS